MERSTTCCFTGHRPTKLPWGENEDDVRCLAVKEKLNEALERAYTAGYRHFICGMARGCDLYFVEGVLELQQRYPDITVEAARPCETQASTWPVAQKRRYYHILERCNYETLIQPSYDRGCMLRRNRYMVERSNHLIAIYDGNPKGGTASTIHYALRQELTLDMIPLE